LLEPLEVIMEDVMTRAAASSKAVSATVISVAMMACATIIAILAFIFTIPYSAEIASTVGALGLVLLYVVSQSGDE
jgi:hypothetical protein